MNVLSIDVEDWFHILDSPATPTIERWGRLESRLQLNLERLLALLDETNTRVTLFWLGWAGQRYKGLLRRCHEAGHEIASHSYSHALCRKIGPSAFREEILRARLVLEDTIGNGVRTFRAPGLEVNKCLCASWCLQLVKEAGYEYDSSTWCRGPAHADASSRTPGIYTIETDAGPLVEVPVSAVMLGGRPVMPLGGGHLRILPKWLIRRRINQLQNDGNPFVIYVHPRDIDADGPCLPLGGWRRFKFSVNRQNTESKISWLCHTYALSTISKLVAAHRGSSEFRPGDSGVALPLPVQVPAPLQRRAKGTVSDLPTLTGSRTS